MDSLWDENSNLNKDSDPLPISYLPSLSRLLMQFAGSNLSDLGDRSEARGKSVHFFDLLRSIVVTI